MSLDKVSYGKYPIRKITKGRIIEEKFVYEGVMYSNKGMSYFIGQKQTRDKYPIIDIRYDEKYYIDTKEPRFHIFLDNGSEYILWKTLAGSDITVEYDIYYQEI